MYKFPSHIPFRYLSDYVEGHLSISQRVQIEAHLAVCMTCSATVQRIGAGRDVTRAGGSEETPRTLIDRFRRLFRFLTRRSSTVPVRRPRIPAVLHFDSLQRTGPSGLRSRKPGTRQFLFRTAAEAIDLRIEPAGVAWTVSGQVLGESIARGRAILQSAAGTTEADFNELSEFILPGLQAGMYTLILDLESVEVEIEELRIGM